MTRKRDCTVVGQKKLLKPNVTLANTRQRKKDSMSGVCNTDDSSSSSNSNSKLKTKAAVLDDSAEGASGSFQDEQNSLSQFKRIRKQNKKLEVNSVKDKAILKSAIDLVTEEQAGHCSDSDPSRKKIDKATSTLDGAVTEAREALNIKHPSTSAVKSAETTKKVTKRKRPFPFLNKKLLGRKELKFINNLKSYRDQPSMVTRLKEGNVPKPKPRKRTLSGEFELLDEGLLRKQLKVDESLLIPRTETPKSPNVNSKETKPKKSYVNISKQSDEDGDKETEVDERQTSKSKSEQSDFRKFQNDTNKSSDSSARKTVKRNARLKKLTLKSIFTRRKKKKKKTEPTYADPPVLIAEPNSSDSFESQSVHESENVDISFTENTPVTSPPPVLEKAVDLVLPQQETSRPVKRKRGRPRVKDPNAPKPVKVGPRRRRGRPKLEDLKNGKLKSKRKRGTYDFPGSKKKPKSALERKSALFMAVRHVRAGKRKPRNNIVTDREGNIDRESVDKELDSENKAEEEISEDSSLPDLVSSDKKVDPEVSEDKLIVKDDDIHLTLSDSDSDLDDLPLVSFLQKTKSPLKTAVLVKDNSDISVNVSSLTSIITSEGVAVKSPIQTSSKLDQVNSDSKSDHSCSVSSSEDTIISEKICPILKATAPVKVDDERCSTLKLDIPNKLTQTGDTSEDPKNVEYKEEKTGEIVSDPQLSQKSEVTPDGMNILVISGNSSTAAPESKLDVTFMMDSENSSEDANNNDEIVKPAVTVCHADVKTVSPEPAGVVTVADKNLDAASNSTLNEKPSCDSESNDHIHNESQVEVSIPGESEDPNSRLQSNSNVTHQTTDVVATSSTEIVVKKASPLEIQTESSKKETLGESAVSMVTSDTVSTCHLEDGSTDMDKTQCKELMNVDKQPASDPSGEVSGIKVKLTRNKGSYEISGHSRSTGSESDETTPVLVSKEPKPDVSKNMTVEEQDVFSELSDANSTVSCAAVEEQNISNEDSPDSDNRRVPPLTIKLKNSVSKPVRQFALRPKLSRSPIEIIAMKQRKIEEEYQQHEAYRLARRLEKQMMKQKQHQQGKAVAEAKVSPHMVPSKTDRLLAHCKPCHVRLVDFVKQLKISTSDSESNSSQTRYESESDENKPKGIKLKIKNISKQPKIVGKRGRPPKLKPRHPVTESILGNEKEKTDLNEEGFVGSFVEFLKRKSESENVLKPASAGKSISEAVQKDTLKPCHTEKRDAILQNKSIENIKYCCKSCDFTTNVKQTMEMHVYRHIPGICFKCGYCDSDFASMASACAHAKNEHVDQESNIVKSREITESDHYYTECLLTQDSETAPVVINVVVKGNVGYSVPPKRFICTHCKYSTNVKSDIDQHALDLHGSDHVYICTLCSDSFYHTEQEIVNHCSSTHPSRPYPYRQLPSYYDIEQLKEVQKLKQDDRGNIFERMTHLFQAPHGIDENQPDELIRQQHYHQAREFLYIQEGWMSKTSAEADSTTRDSENVVDVSSKDTEEQNSSLSDTPMVDFSESGVSGKTNLQSVKNVNYQEQHTADDSLHDESGISQLKIIEVVSLRDQQTELDSAVDTTEAAANKTKQNITEFPGSRQITDKRNKLKANASAPSRSSNLPEIDVDAIVQRNERLTCTYKCQKCNIHSPYLSAMVEHLKNHHSDIELFTCPYCKGSRGKRPQFSSELSVHEHVKMNHPTNFAKNEVSLSDAAKEFVEVIAIPSGAECSKVGNTFVIEKDIYMCLKCQAHMPSLDYTFSHLEREHTEVFVNVCPHCKVFKDKSDDVVFQHISSVHNKKSTDESLPLAIEDDLFIRVPSISKSGSYSERLQGNRLPNKKGEKPKTFSDERGTSVQKVSVDGAKLTSQNKSENVLKPAHQTVPSKVSMTKKNEGADSNVSGVKQGNVRKQTEPTQALVMDCETINEDTGNTSNENDIIHSHADVTTATMTTTTVTPTLGNVNKMISSTASSPSVELASDRTVTTLSPSSVITTSSLPLSKISSIGQCAPRLKSSIYSIADRLHRLHAQNQTGDKSPSTGDKSLSAADRRSPSSPVTRPVLKVPSIPHRTSTPVSQPPISQTPISQTTAVINVTTCAGLPASKQKSLLFSNCPLDLSGTPVTKSTVSSAEHTTTVSTSAAPLPKPPTNDDELRPESFQIFNLKPKLKTDSPQIVRSRSIQQQLASPIIPGGAQVSSLQPLHQAYPVAHLTQMPFQQVPVRFDLGIQGFIATGQPTLITLRPHLIGSSVVQEPVNYQRMSVPQQTVQMKQVQKHQQVPRLKPDSLRPASAHGIPGVDSKNVQQNLKHQRPHSSSPAPSPSTKLPSPTYARHAVRQQLLQQAEFYCPYCNEFRPLREYEVIPHIQRSHPGKEVLFLRRDKS